MRILFDNGAPRPLIPDLKNHSITTARAAGWAETSDGALITFAERAGYDVLLTTDKRMLAQQNWRNRKIAVVVLGNSKWEIAQRYVRRIAAVVDASTPGSYTEVEIPYW